MGAQWGEGIVKSLKQLTVLEEVPVNILTRVARDVISRSRNQNNECIGCRQGRLEGVGDSVGTLPRGPVL